MEQKVNYADQRHWKCKLCGAESPIEAKVCSACGTDLMINGVVKMPGVVTEEPRRPLKPKILLGVVAALAALLALFVLAGRILPPPAAVNILMEDPFEPPQTDAQSENEEASDPGDYPVFHSSYLRKQIRSLTILDTLKDAPEDSEKCWEVTAYANGGNKNGKVLAWVEEHGGYCNLFIGGEGGVTAPADCSAMFQGYTELERVEWNGAFLTSQTAVMDGMFADCAKLVVLDVTPFDMSGVESVEGMFMNCVNLKTLNMDGWNLSHVTNFSYMFRKCEKLASLDVTGFDTSAATSMYAMFARCGLLEALDVSGFQTSNVTDFAYMFRGCEKLTSLDVSGFDTSAATSMRAMFNECASLETLDVSGFQTSKVTDFSLMFQECGKLTSLDVSGFDTSAATSMSAMFNECASLETLDVSGFQTSKVESFYTMFLGCEKLTSLDVRQFDFGKAGDTDYMFHSCRALTSLTFTKPVALGQHMFCNDKALQYVAFTGALKQAAQEENMFEGGCKLKIYYPALDSSWSEAAGKAYGGALTWVKTVGDMEITGGAEGVSPAENYQYLFDDNIDTNWSVRISKSPYVEWNVREPIPVTQFVFTVANDAEQYPYRRPRSLRLLGRASEEEEWFEIVNDSVESDSLSTNSSSKEITIHYASSNGEIIPYAELPKYKFFRLEVTESFGDDLVQLAGIQVNSEEVT